MKKTIYLSFMLAAVLFTSNVGAEPSQCDSILNANLADESAIVDKTSARDTATYAACSMTFKEFSKSMGASAEGHYAVIGGSGSYNETIES
jgi:hypothetical protein